MFGKLCGVWRAQRVCLKSRDGQQKGWTVDAQLRNRRVQVPSKRQARIKADAHSSPTQHENGHTQHASGNEQYLTRKALRSAHKPAVRAILADVPGRRPWTSSKGSWIQ
jgi:hypothetical protein